MSKRRQYDSSLTRVEPVFDALSALGRPDWVSELLTLVEPNPTAPPRGSTPNLSFETGCWGKTETSLQPPVALLSWLVRNLGRSGVGRPGESDSVEKKRRALWDGNATVIEEALGLLRRSTREKGWHVLEGPTCPDAYIVTPDALIVVEGKRTEAGPTTDTTWMRGRHQMLRHVDAAWEIRGARVVYGFFVVEANLNEHPTDVPGLWREAARSTTSPEAIARSLPHRGAAERDGIASSFIGVTTWQAIVAHFGLDLDRVLPHDVNATRQEV